MFINFYTARRKHWFILMYTCGLTVVIKRICYVTATVSAHFRSLFGRWRAAAAMRACGHDLPVDWLRNIEQVSRTSRAVLMRDDDGDVQLTGRRRWRRAVAAVNNAIIDPSLTTQNQRTTALSLPATVGFCQMMMTLLLLMLLITHTHTHTHTHV